MILGLGVIEFSMGIACMLYFIYGVVTILGDSVADMAYPLITILLGYVVCIVLLIHLGAGLDQEIYISHMEVICGKDYT